MRSTTKRPGPANLAMGSGGFTLLEVMIALALLGLGLVVLIKSAAGDIFNAQQAHMIGVATDLARAKMYQIEEKLLKDGFSDTEQAEEDRPFEDEGWPAVLYSYKVEEVELPTWDKLQAMAAGRCKGSGSEKSGSESSKSSSESKSSAASATSGSASPSGESVEEGCFENSALGGMLTQFGGGGLGGGGSGKGADVDAAAGASFIQGQYQMFQQILKVTIRKVTLTVKWKVLGSDRDMKVVAFFTDAGSMDKVLNGMGAQELPAAGSNKQGSKQGGQ